MFSELSQFPFFCLEVRLYLHLCTAVRILEDSGRPDDDAHRQRRRCESDHLDSFWARILGVRNQPKRGAHRLSLDFHAYPFAILRWGPASCIDLMLAFQRGRLRL